MAAAALQRRAVETRETSEMEKSASPHTSIHIYKRVEASTANKMLIINIKCCNFEFMITKKKMSRTKKKVNAVLGFRYSNSCCRYDCMFPMQENLPTERNKKKLLINEYELVMKDPPKQPQTQQQELRRSNSLGNDYRAYR